MCVGIDLAADPRRTGLAALRESGGTVLVEQVTVGADDTLIVETVEAADYVGIDVPLGWPQRFVDLLSLHAAGTLPAPASTAPEWRRGLAMRDTDREVHRRTGLTPVGVFANRIAHPALPRAVAEARLRGSRDPRAAPRAGRRPVAGASLAGLERAPRALHDRRRCARCRAGRAHRLRSAPRTDPGATARAARHRPSRGLDPSAPQPVS